MDDAAKKHRDAVAAFIVRLRRDAYREGFIRARQCRGLDDIARALADESMTEVPVLSYAQVAMTMPGYSNSDDIEADAVRSAEILLKGPSW